MATTWGQLSNDDAGKTVTFTYPWESTPTVAQFGHVGYLSGYDDLEDGTSIERWTHFLQFPDRGLGGASFRADAVVEVA